MSQLDDIRQGLAAQLRICLPASDGQVSAYLEPNPGQPALQVAGVDANGIERLSYGATRRLTLLIEGCFLHDISGQKKLNEFLSDDTLEQAVEADQQLTSRLLDDGSVLAGQPACADSVAFAGYRGQTPHVLESGVKVLLATWAVDVLA